MNAELNQTIETAADMTSADQVQMGGYEAPELVRIDSAKALVRGFTYTEWYYDCYESTTSRYIHNC